MKHESKNTCTFINLDKSDLKVGWCNEMSTNPRTFDLEIPFFYDIYFSKPKFSEENPEAKYTYNVLSRIQSQGN